jgi:hypothetical protein
MKYIDLHADTILPIFSKVNILRFMKMIKHTLILNDYKQDMHWHSASLFGYQMKISILLM